MRKSRFIGFIAILVFTAAAVCSILIISIHRSEHRSDLESQNPVYRYSVEERTEQAASILSDDSLQEYIFLDNEDYTLKQYNQPVEQYGNSSAQTWIILELRDGREILLQDGGLSRPEDAAAADESIYIAGRTTGFSTISGFNVMKYTLTDDSVIVESVLDESSLDDRFNIYQDEYNLSLRSALPVTSEGLGKLSFRGFNEDMSFDAQLLNPEYAPEWDEHSVHFILNDNGKYHNA